MIDTCFKYLLICKVSTLSPFTIYRQFVLLDLLTVWIWLVLSSWYNLTCFFKFTVNFCCCSVTKRVQLFATACQTPLSFSISQSLLKLVSIESMMPPSHLILCCSLLLPSIFPSIRVFKNESALRIRWPKYWSFSFSISSSDEYSGLISFRIDWFDLLAFQGTLKSLLQHCSSKVSILQHSVFFMVHLSHPYMTTGKTIGLTRWVVVSKATSLPLNALSKFVLPLFPWSKRLLNSWLQSPSAGILEPMKIKSVTASTPSPFQLP